MPEIAQAIYDHLATYRRRLYQFLAGDETALEGCTVVLRWYERTEGQYTQPRGAMPKMRRFPQTGRACLNSVSGP